MKKSCLSTFCNYFFVYLPVLLLTILIVMVYLSYVFTYLIYMIRIDQEEDPTNFFLSFTTTASSAKVKGKILLYISLFLIIMLFVSMYTAVFSNPGYFPSPLELEYKLLSIEQSAEKNKKDGNFLTKFSANLLNGPMTSNERNDFQKKLRMNYQDKLRDDPLHMKYSNEEIIDSNKRNYMETNNQMTSCVHSNTDVYLDIYKGIDITKMTLCGTCLRVKVERSHHCRQCQKCVLKMDHHCPWLANCIAFNNLKAFILLQFYGILACSLVAFTYWESIIDYNKNYETNVIECWFTLSVYLLNFGLLSFLLWLAAVNWTNLYYGMTVIENSERKRFPSTKSVNIYDMGPYRNFTNVFGRNPFVWWLPFFSNKNGNGYVFETNTNNFRIH